MKQEKIFIKNEQGEKLAGIFHKVNDNKQVVIVCHGHTGNKEEKIIINICEELNKANINSFRFDFSGNGESEGNFINSITTKSIQDIKSITDYFYEKNYEVGLIGHSRAGTEVIVFCSQNEKIKFVISIAGLSNTKEFIDKIFPEQKEKILNGKLFYWWENRKGKKYPVTPEFFKDLESYNLLEEVKKIKQPKLFINGSEDKVILPEEAESFYKNANESKEIKIIEGADHCFTNPKLLKEMIDYCINWIKKINVFD